jgi:NAD(P)-dependent dehydrogenase (short-subunit alcohol dehydrogenase family)
MAIAVVTGTSTGIGLATALTLARAGHTVYVTMRNPKTGSEELRATAEREHLPLHIAALDVDSDQSVCNAFAKILAEAGRIDVLVNNAGISGIGPVEENPIAAFRATMETNYFGALRCIQAVLPGMRETVRLHCQHHIDGWQAFRGAAQAAYSSSKFALEAASESLAQEVKAFGVRVAIVEPGVIATPIFGKVQPPPADSNYPHGRRIYELFRTSLENAVSPYVVGKRSARSLRVAPGN